MLFAPMQVPENHAFFAEPNSRETSRATNPAAAISEHDIFLWSFFLLFFRTTFSNIFSG